MHELLQWLGGVFFLLNKVFFSISEHAQVSGRDAAARKWKIAAWAIYLCGLPPWIIIFVLSRNWIAASLEAGGAPAMLLGLIIAIRGKAVTAPRWLDRFALICIPLGFALSMYDFGGLTTLTQFLEIGLVIGFLVGTYLIAKGWASGYLWYVLMHVSCGWLMWIQGYPWLFIQQIVSLFFIIDAYRMARRLAFAANK